jgi:hypothetical protein
MSSEYINQLEESNEALSSQLELTRKVVESLEQKIKLLNKKLLHIRPGKLGADLVVGNIVLARSIGSVNDGIISYDLEVFGEVLFGYVTTDIDFHLGEFDKIIKTGKMPKHSDARVYPI